MRFTVNTDLDIIRAREALVTTGLGGGKRPTAWAQYDYPNEPTFAQYLQAYERNGAAHGAVHKLLSKCWESLPRVKAPGDGEPGQLERAIEALFKAAKVWPALRDLDRRNMVGRYAGLIYRLADNKPLREPADRAAKLVEVVPVYEDQLRVVAWHADSASDLYGKPAMFQYRSQPVNSVDTQGMPMEWVDVHPSRVQIMAEGSVGDMFSGVPFLKAGYNDLVDIEKITGGSAESYLKNSARVLSFEYDKDAIVNAYDVDGTAIDVKVAHKEQTDKLNASIDSSIVMQGGKASVLQTSISDPTGPFQVAANKFAASVGLPFTILFGQQTGRLASGEDRQELAARGMERRVNELTPLIEEFVSRMQGFGLLPPGEFVVEWPDLLAPSDKDKLENLKALTAAMRDAVGAGVPELFTAEELRRAAGYDQAQ